MSISGPAVTTGDEAWKIAGSSALPPSASTPRVRSRSVTRPTGRAGGSCSATKTMHPTSRSRIVSAASRAVQPGGAVTTHAVMTSRTSMTYI
jgi:hypothetical protein